MAGLLIAVLLTIVAFLIWWLLIETEGVYLGRSPVIWLYDVYANQYDSIKDNQDDDEHQLLAVPLLTTIYPETDPLVLDVATGTARIPLALCHHAAFEGHVIGVDLSEKMLNAGAKKIADRHFQDYVTLIRQGAEKLPFEDDTFDIVTCMESLEFMMQPEAVLSECVRVLRPGGVLLITQRINTRWMPGKLWSREELETLLTDAGIENLEFHRWQLDYTKVWGQKSGEMPYSGIVALHDLLRCPDCDGMMIEQETAWCCENCAKCAPITENGIINLQELR